MLILELTNDECVEVLTRLHLEHSARFLAECGAILIAASDSTGAIHDATGFEVARLIALKDGGGSVTDYDRGQRLDRDAILDVDCDNRRFSIL